MFRFKRDSDYKEDALKWREHEAKERKRIEKEECTLTIVVGLVEGEQVVLRKTFTGFCQYAGFNDHWYVHTAKQVADNFYDNLKNDAAFTGITVDGVTYMPHTIATITRQDD